MINVKFDIEVKFWFQEKIEHAKKPLKNAQKFLSFASWLKSQNLSSDSELVLCSQNRNYFYKPVYLPNRNLLFVEEKSV